MKPHVLFVAGTKGGVGKSFAACQLVAAAEDLGMSVTAFDSDTENSTLKNLLPGKTKFLDDTNNDYPLDDVISSLFEDTVPDFTVVDMKAGTSRNSMEWFAAVPWDKLLPRAEISILCSITVDPDATRTLSPWLVYFDRLSIPVEYIIVKNAKDGKDFSFYESMIPNCLADMKHCRHSEIIFPALDKNYISILNNAKLTLKAAISTDKSNTSLKTVMAQARLTNYYHACTDPLMMIMAHWIPEEEQTEDQKQIIAKVEKRIRLDKGLPVK